MRADPEKRTMGAWLAEEIAGPLGCDVFLALSHDARDRCDADQHCDPSRLLPALRPSALRVAVISQDPLQPIEKTTPWPSVALALTWRP